MGDYEYRLTGLLVVTDECSTDRWMCSINEYYEYIFSDPYLHPFSSPTHAFLASLLDYCFDDDVDYDDPLCYDELLAKARLVHRLMGEVWYFGRR